MPAPTVLLVMRKAADRTGASVVCTKDRTASVVVVVVVVAVVVDATTA